MGVIIDNPANMFCATCKHKGEVLSFPTPSFDQKPTRFHVCDLVKHIKDVGARYEPNFYSEEDAKQADAESPAFVVDGSGYFAAFIVREDFGCNRWEEK